MEALEALEPGGKDEEKEVTTKANSEQEQETTTKQTQAETPTEAATGLRSVFKLGR